MNVDMAKSRLGWVPEFSVNRIFLFMSRRHLQECLKSLSYESRAIYILSLTENTLVISTGAHQRSERTMLQQTSLQIVCVKSV